MKIVAAFVVALAIGAISRGPASPSLAPQAIVGSLLIVAMTAGYVLTDRYLATQASLTTEFQISTRPRLNVGYCLKRLVVDLMEEIPIRSKIRIRAGVFDFGLVRSMLRLSRSSGASRM